MKIARDVKLVMIQNPRFAFRESHGRESSMTMRYESSERKLNGAGRKFSGGSHAVSACR